MVRDMLKEQAVQHTQRDRMQVTATLQSKALSAAFAAGPFAGGSRSRALSYAGRSDSNSCAVAATAGPR